MAGSVYTFTKSASGRNDGAIITVQGTILLGQSGLFLASEVQAAANEGIVLVAGPAVSPWNGLSAPTLAAGSSGLPNGVYICCVTFVTAAGETRAGPEATVTVINNQIQWSSLPVGTAASGVTARKLYRTSAGGAAGTEKLVATVSDNSTTTFTDNVADGSLGAVLPTLDTSAVPGGSGSSQPTPSIFELTSNKGQFGGYGSLDLTGRQPISQIPISVISVSQPTASLLRVDGSSLVSAVEHLNNPTDRSWSKLCRLLGAQERNYGIGGTPLVNSATNLLQGWARPFSSVMNSLPTTGNLADARPLPPAALQHMVNDMGLAGRGDQVNIVATYTAAVVAWTRMMRAGFKWRNVGDGSPFTFSSGWTNQAANNNQGGTYTNRGSTSGSITFAPPLANGFIGGDLTFYFAVDATVRMRAQAKINSGAYIATLDATDRSGANPELALGVGSAYSVASITVPVAPAQSGNTYTVTVDLDEILNNVLFLGCTLSTLPEFLPMLLLVGQPYLNQMPQSSEPALTAANLDAGNAALATIAAGYTDGRCRFVDLMSMRGDQGTNNAVYFQDGLHFGPEGNAEVTRLVMAEVVKSHALVPGYTAGPPEFAGQPDWSGQAGDRSYDPATGLTWVCKSATMGDWVAQTTLLPNAQTTDYTLALSDMGRMLSETSSSLTTITVPPHSAIAFPVGSSIEVMCLGTGGLLVAAGAGVTIDAPDGLQVGAQYRSARLRNIATDVWLLTFLDSAKRTQQRLADIGLISQAFDLELAVSSAAVGSQTVWGALVPLLAGDTVSQIVVATAIAGVGAGVPTLIKLGLVDLVGNILASTADVHADTKWTASPGIVGFTLTASYTATVNGSVYPVILQNGAFTTPMQLCRSNNAAAAGRQFGSAARRLMASTSHTDLTGPLTLVDAGGGAGYWFGVA